MTTGLLGAVEMGEMESEDEFGPLIRAPPWFDGQTRAYTHYLLERREVCAWIFVIEPVSWREKSHLMGTTLTVVPGNRVPRVSIVRIRYDGGIERGAYLFISLPWGLQICVRARAQGVGDPKRQNLLPLGNRSRS